ncbi:hypothetical protein [Helicobacter sp. MIT 14-3879]|uniref:hypothetical protein n=1 Tax=Helicobacter sp. MIT 14-3879 TaxID=2040649 RepID=UPI000E1E4D6C|nr:hypothetical protein [Helicobacter sp. MIT 14-3879]RDU59034.1 hypothetical protein CQA44_11800 [Helicobacter sp. MIT 14-3879]
MRYFVTLYIEPMKTKLEILPISIPHAFLGLTHTHPDILDKEDKELRDEKLKNKDWKDFDKKWYESLETNEFNDGFFGFAPVESSASHWGKVFENNQYKSSAPLRTSSYDNKESGGKVFENNQYVPKWNDNTKQYHYIQRDKTLFLPLIVALLKSHKSSMKPCLMRLKKM